MSMFLVPLLFLLHFKFFPWVVFMDANLPMHRKIARVSQRLRARNYGTTGLNLLCHIVNIRIYKCLLLTSLSPVSFIYVIYKWLHIGMVGGFSVRVSVARSIWYPYNVSTSACASKILSACSRVYNARCDGNLPVAAAAAPPFPFSLLPTWHLNSCSVHSKDSSITLKPLNASISRSIGSVFSQRDSYRVYKVAMPRSASLSRRLSQYV